MPEWSVHPLHNIRSLTIRAGPGSRQDPLISERRNGYKILHCYKHSNNEGTLTLGALRAFSKPWKLPLNNRTKFTILDINT